MKGNLFGTTSEGGGGACLFYGCGTVFELSKTGQETIIYDFLGSPDGAFPFAGLLQGASGNFYGTTFDGGNSSCNDRGPGCGTVFEVNVSGREKILYRLRAKKNEELPAAGLIADASGNLYGTTAGNQTTSFGTVFKLDASGKETLLYRFTGGGDGCLPIGDLTFDSAGNLYGAASLCGANGDGVVFKISF
jgi:uncharacterized repeat protein (TIGR03803 family)